MTDNWKPNETNDASRTNVAPCAPPVPDTPAPLLQADNLNPKENPQWNFVKN